MLFADTGPLRRVRFRAYSRPGCARAVADERHTQTRLASVFLRSLCRPQKGIAMISRFDNRRGHEIEIAQRLIERWYVAGWDNGCLWIQAQGHALCLRQFCTILKRTQRLFKNDLFRVVVFHFDRVEAHPDDLEIVVRMFQNFAKATQTKCRIVQCKSRRENQTFKFSSPSRQSSVTRPSKHPPVKLNGISVVIE